MQWQQFSYQFNRALWKGLDFVFPPECPGCNTYRARWCSDCQASIRGIPSPICPICGDPGNKNEVCPDCLNTPPKFDQMRSAAIFEGKIREALHRLKYRRDIGLGEALAPHLVGVYQEEQWDIDFVTAVPLSSKRHRTRGYNQAELLAKPFAAQIHKPYFNKALKRSKDTLSQINLSIEQRRENVSGAFYANTMYVNQKSVIIIDDVSTTGSTISECADALKQAGANNVFALTLARAPIKMNTFSP